MQTEWVLRYLAKIWWKIQKHWWSSVSGVVSQNVCMNIGQFCRSLTIIVNLQTERLKGARLCVSPHYAIGNLLRFSSARLWDKISFGGFLIPILTSGTKWGTQGIIGREIDSVAGTIAEKRMGRRRQPSEGSGNCNLANIFWVKCVWGSFLDLRIWGPTMARGISVCNFKQEFYIGKVIWGGGGEIQLPATPWSS